MKLSFRNKILFTIALSCLICTVAAIFITRSKMSSEGKKDLISKSSSILSRIEVGAEYVARMKTLDGVVHETIQKFPDGQVPEEQKLKILKSVPIYAAFEIGKSGAEKENYTFRIASDAPRKKENQANADELESIKKFRANPELKEIIEESADGKYILVTRPIRIMESRGCLTCHGEPSTSPWKNGKDILGYQMENMKDGDLRATFTIVSSLEPLQAATRASTTEVTLWSILITVFSMFVGFMVIRKPVANLTALAVELNETADEVAAMSSQIASSSVELSAGATQQAAALEQTTASMEQMSAMVTSNSDNAAKSQDSAVDSQKSADRGKTVVHDMILSIEDIDRSNIEIMKQIEDSNQQIENIVKVITEIGNKTKVINDIVFQTKLLSFNASVEAARAGENGKGFAVVADEIGKLAQMSGNSAAEITKMLDESTQKVESIVQDTKNKVNALVQNGKGKVEHGTEIAKQCGVVLDEIVQSVDSVNQMVMQIAEGSLEQSKGVKEINSAMIQLNSVTQQNTAASQESSAASERLSYQAKVLRKSVQSVLETLHGDDENHKKAS